SRAARAAAAERSGRAAAWPSRRRSARRRRRRRSGRSKRCPPAPWPPRSRARGRARRAAASCQSELGEIVPFGFAPPLLFLGGRDLLLVRLTLERVLERDEEVVAIRGGVRRHFAVDPSGD